VNAKKIAAFAVGPIGGAVLGFITLPIITWFYSAEDIGRIAMLQVVSSFCILLFSLGLDQAYVRDYHESEHRPALFKIALLPGLLLLVMSLALCLMVPGFISEVLFSVDSASLSALVALCLLSGFVSRFLSLVLRMQERGLAFSMSQVLPKLLFLSAVSIYVLFSFGFDLFYLIIAQTLSVLAVTLVYGWNTRQEWLAALKQGVDLEKLKAMLGFGAPLVVGGIAFWGMTAIDKVFLRNLSTFEELGVYSVATSFAAAAIVFQSVFSIVWAPTVYKWAAEGINTDRIDRVTEYVLFAVVALFCAAGVFSWIITYLLPPQYESVQFILPSCMAYPLFYTLSEATAVGLGIARKSSYAMLAALIGCAFSFVGNYLLIPLYGASGASISTAFAFWVFLFCRTELSCLVWRPISRWKIYATTLTCLFLSVLFTLKGTIYHLEFVFLWLLLFLAFAFSSLKLFKGLKLRGIRSS